VHTSFIRQQAPFSGAIAGEHASLHHLILLISNPYYLENHFVFFVFLFLFCCLDGIRQPPCGRTGEIAKGLR
jgi:hypothetical protein